MRVALPDLVANKKTELLDPKREKNPPKAWNELKTKDEWAEKIADYLNSNKEEVYETDKHFKLFHKHFSCSEHEHSHEAHQRNNPKASQDSPIKNFQDREASYFPTEEWEADTYRYEFNLSIFFKCLLISITDVLGLKVLLYLHKWISGSRFLDNFYRLSIINVFINWFGWINMVLMIHSIYERAWIYADARSLSYMVGLLFLSIIGASEMSFINPKVPEVLETVRMSGESCVKAGSWRVVRIQDELKRTILRLNFDASSFFMRFIENTAVTAKKYPRFPIKNNDYDELSWPGKPEKEERSNNESIKFALFPPLSEADGKDRLYLCLDIAKPDLIATAVTFEILIFWEKYLTKPSRYDDEKAYAYRYARGILEAYEEKESKYPYAHFLMIVGVIGTIVVSCLKFDAFDKSSENFTIRCFEEAALLLLNAIVTLATLFLISEGTNIIWNRLCFVKGLTELISEDQPPVDSIFRKDNCPMINIFDFESLRTWASLRMIFMSLNQKRLDSISLAISIIVAIQLITISVFGFFYFTAANATEKAFFLQYIFFFGTPTVIYMIFVLLFITIGAQVNNQYKDHIYMMKTLKITIDKLFALYPTFTGQERIQPSTYLYARGLRYLQEEYIDELSQKLVERCQKALEEAQRYEDGPEEIDRCIEDLEDAKRYQKAKKELFGNTQIPQEILDEKLQKVNKAYDTIIAELEVEEQCRPLQLLGIPMTDSFAGTVFGTILTVLMIPIGKYLAEITGWD